ncbi:hypothetical protein BS78_K233600 [Paspalum vaginatum]|uniref:Uncharacterized protein n=1 Tax=Paspalum vaginatum TaxID=158149 RepID=A0A9W7XEF2_9POAL|nr:hypothetical protein BS78_K233600 [Paspalum vaginatum]
MPRPSGGGPSCPSLRSAPTAAPCASPPHRLASRRRRRSTSPPPPGAAPPRCPRCHTCSRAPAPPRLAAPPRVRPSLPPESSRSSARVSGGQPWWGERPPGRCGWAGWRRQPNHTDLRRQRMTRASGVARPLAWGYRRRRSSDCPGTQLEEAGKADACAGCHNQQLCATAPKGPDPTANEKDKQEPPPPARAAHLLMMLWW